MYQNVLKEIYEKAANRPNNYTWEYRDYVFKKYDHNINSAHTEVELYNPQGNKVESYTIAAYDDFKSFSNDVMELVSFGPDSVEDWLNRDQ